jgi:hypothetical protein
MTKPRAPPRRIGRSGRPAARSNVVRVDAVYAAQQHQQQRRLI